MCVCVVCVFGCDGAAGNAQLLLFLKQYIYVSHESIFSLFFFLMERTASEAFTFKFVYALGLTLKKEMGCRRSTYKSFMAWIVAEGVKKVWVKSFPLCAKSATLMLIIL